ncbi:MAG: bifunctional DNA primase/polymerase [Rhizomicrobium sp.]
MVIETVISYCRRGWNPIPIQFKTKKPTGTAWQTRTITEADVPKYFNGAPQNVGIIMGPSSGGLTDLDLDCVEAITIAPYVMPKTEAIFGRASKPDSHREYITTLWATLGKAVLKFTDPIRPKHQNTLLEVRVGGNSGAQSIFPGSVHESGEEIKWSVAGEPAIVDNDELLRCANLLAALSLIARYWPGEGARHDAALTVGGFLARCGYKPPAVRCFVEAVAKAAGDNDPRDRFKAAEDQANRHQQNETTRGYPSLKEMVGDERIAKKIAELLDYGGDSSGCVTSSAAGGAVAPANSEEFLSLMFADRHEADLRFVAKWGQWFRWDKTRWLLEETLHAFDMARLICREAANACSKTGVAKGLASAKTVAAVERLAKADRKLAATFEQWDTDANKLNTPEED